MNQNSTLNYPCLPEKANLGYVVIVCWKNEIKLKDRKRKEDVSSH